MNYKNRLLSLALAGVLTLSLTSCQSTPAAPAGSATPSATPSQTAGATFTAGTYNGEAQGMEGIIKVAVTLSADKIEKIEVLESSETETIGEVALKSLPDMVIAAQSTQIDAITSATVTCDAFYTAVNTALEASGADPASLTPLVTDGAQAGEQETLSCDLVIVGAGGAGMTAALKAQEQGLNVILLEKQAFVGGATAMSSSSALCQGTRVQAEQNVEDSPLLCMTDLLKVGNYENDATPTWLLSSESGRAIDWLNDDMGVLFKDSVGSASAEYSVGRARASVTGSGAGLCQDLQTTMGNKDGITLMLNTRAYELTTTDGVVNGVNAKDVNTGKEYTVDAKAVLLATGGYCFDPDYIGSEFDSLPCSGSKANTGDGIDMALPLGAVLQNMDMVAVAGHGIRKGESAQHTKPGCMTAYRTTGTVLVNMDGKRFTSETGADAAIVEKMYTEGRVFMLMDEAAFQAYSAGCVKNKYFSQEELDQWLTENGSGTTVFAHGETLAAVAGQVGMNAENLAATVELYNSYVAGGEDKDFGRTISTAIGEGPYYLVEQCLRYSTTLGGLTINQELQLVDQVNAPIPGLYAAGEVIGGVFGANFPPSSGVGWALTSGMLAGESIAENLNK